jgi:hypothetical protein
MKLLPRVSLPINHPYLDNKYTQWYYSIIESARIRQLVGYTEQHHIVPDSFFLNRNRKGTRGWIEGNSNDPSNLVRLTAREHLLCHQLLIYIVSTDSAKAKMIYALNYMVGYRTNSHFVTASLYEKCRKMVSQVRTGRKHSPETCKKIGESSKGRTPSEESNRKRSEALKGKKQPLELVAKRAAKLKGRIVSEQTRALLSQINMGKVSKLRGIPRSEEVKEKSRQKNKQNYTNGMVNPFKGKKHSDLSKQKMSEIKKGKTQSEETKRKISENNKGRKLSDETKKKISESRQGLKHSDESKRKMSASAKNRRK